MSDFLSLGIRPEINQALQEQRVTDATPVQEMTIPVALAGTDVIAQAQTGTGKTFAFLLPILERVDPKRQSLQALVITPTRELAIQITNEAKKLMTHLNDINVLAVYGGKDVEGQARKLKNGAHIAVGTPGRLLDHLRRGTIRLSGVSVVVLDEADQMLQLGFLDDVESIIQRTPQSRQTMLFSATMPPQVRSLAKRYLRSPKDIRMKSKSVVVEDVRQVVVETTDRTKQETLRRLIDEYRPYLAIVFCRTKRRAKSLCEALQMQGYLTDELHGDLSQKAREQVIRKFRDAKIQLLVATDVAARGLDVEGITHVFNYDIPHDVESYIHRIGRTGRAGDKGLAVTLVAPKDRPSLSVIEKGLQQSIEKQVSNPLRSGTASNGGSVQGKQKKNSHSPGRPTPPEKRRRHQGQTPTNRRGAVKSRSRNKRVR